MSCGPAGAAATLAGLKDRVTDLTGTLNSQERSALEQKLAAFEARKGSQIAVLIVRTTAVYGWNPTSPNFAMYLWQRIGDGGCVDCMPHRLWRICAGGGVAWLSATIPLA